MKAKSLVIALLLVTGCTTADQYDSQGRAPRSRRAAVVSGLEMMPPPEWWQDSEFARAVRLSDDQRRQLEALYSANEDELVELQRDSVAATLRLRTLLETEQPSAEEILEAGKQLQSLRDTIFDRHLQLLAEERQILTLDQWEELQEIMDLRRNFRRGRDPYGPYIGRGWYGRAFPF